MKNCKGLLLLVSMVEMLARDERLTLAAVAGNANMSLSYAEQLASLLVQAKIIQGTRGPGGGYKLVRPIENITLKEVLSALMRKPSIDGETLIEFYGNFTLVEYMGVRARVSARRQQGA